MFFRRQSHQTLCFLIAFQNFSIGIRDGDSHGKGFKQNPVFFQTHPQCIFRVFALGNICQRGKKMVYGSVRIALAGHIKCCINHGTVFADKPFVQRIKIAFSAQNLVKQFQISFQIIRMRKFSPGAFHKLFFGISEHPGQAVIDLHPSFFRRSHAHAHCSHAEVIFEFISAFAQFFLCLHPLQFTGRAYGSKFENSFAQGAVFQRIPADHGNDSDKLSV